MLERLCSGAANVRAFDWFPIKCTKPLMLDRAHTGPDKGTKFLLQPAGRTGVRAGISTRPRVGGFCRSPKVCRSGTRKTPTLSGRGLFGVFRGQSAGATNRRTLPTLAVVLVSPDTVPLPVVTVLATIGTTRTLCHAGRTTPAESERCAKW